MTPSPDPVFSMIATVSDIDVDGDGDSLIVVDEETLRVAEDINAAVAEGINNENQDVRSERNHDSDGEAVLYAADIPAHEQESKVEEPVLDDSMNGLNSSFAQDEGDEEQEAEEGTRESKVAILRAEGNHDQEMAQAKLAAAHEPSSSPGIWAVRGDYSKRKKEEEKDAAGTTLSVAEATAATRMSLINRGLGQRLRQKEKFRESIRAVVQTSPRGLGKNKNGLEQGGIRDGITKSIPGVLFEQQSPSGAKATQCRIGSCDSIAAIQRSPTNRGLRQTQKQSEDDERRESIRAIVQTSPRGLAKNQNLRREINQGIMNTIQGVPIEDMSPATQSLVGHCNFTTAPLIPETCNISGMETSRAAFTDASSCLVEREIDVKPEEDEIYFKPEEDEIDVDPQEHDATAASSTPARLDAVLTSAIEDEESSESESAEDVIHSNPEEAGARVTAPPRSNELPDALEAVVNAFTVDESNEIEVDRVVEEVRRRLFNELNEAVEAEVVPRAQLPEVVDSSDDTVVVWKRRFYGTLACIIVGLVGVAIFLAVGVGVNTDGDSNNALEEFGDQQTLNRASDTKTTIASIRERGFVRCGLYGSSLGFSNPNPETGELEGINVDQCRAIALAVLGDPRMIEAVMATTLDRFEKLKEKAYDVLAQTVTHNMGRDVFERSSNSGFTFSMPYFYSGLTTHEQALRDLVPGTVIVPVAAWSPQDVIERFKTGDCNVVAAGPVSFQQINMEYDDNLFKVGQSIFLREPLALVTREGDAGFSNLVNSIVNIFYLAEAENVTKSNAADMALLYDGHDSELVSMAVDIVSTFGNYGELYEKNLQQLLPRSGLNRIYRGKAMGTGLLYSVPLGEVETPGPDPPPDSTLGIILT